MDLVEGLSDVGPDDFVDDAGGGGFQRLADELLVPAAYEVVRLVERLVVAVTALESGVDTTDGA
ncbi:hypothetical protein ABT168_04355 [Streptomyces sp. NPDC001793]|uniref:hypothetical protein n=1 Tax=Streptomyces sp. NPDC001793 TaxID=3154657 RepID=UPI00332422F9